MLLCIEISCTRLGHFGRVARQSGQLSHVVWDDGTLNVTLSQSTVHSIIYCICKYFFKLEVLTSGHGKRKEMLHFLEGQGMEILL